jgi:hypothetical protein
MSDLENRRRALAAEAEVYRQTIKLEIENIRLYARQSSNKYRKLGPRNPLFVAVAPLLTVLLRRTGPVKKLRLLSKVAVAWQIFNRFAPLVPGIIVAIKSRRENRKPFREEQKTPAATI